MKKIFYFLIIIDLFCCISPICGKTNEFIPNYSVILPLEQGEKMMQQCSRTVPDNIEKFFNPTKQDIQLLEENFVKLLTVKSTNCCFPGIKIKDLNNYGFQFIGIVINSEKFIYINAFYYETIDEFSTFYKNWQTQPVIWCDGGDSFWGVLFSLNKKRFSQLSVNGVA